MAATTWNSFTALFAENFPLFKGPKLMGIASPYWQQCKGAVDISFDRYGITADGEYISIIPRPVELPVPVFNEQEVPIGFFPKKKSYVVPTQTQVCTAIFDKLPTPQPVATQPQPEKRGPNPYTMYVKSHKDRTSDMKAAINAWKYVNKSTRARYRDIIENGEWLAFYRFLPFTRKLGLTPFQHLSEFEMLSPALKNALNKEY